MPLVEVAAGGGEKTLAAPRRGEGAAPAESGRVRLVPAADLRGVLVSPELDQRLDVVDGEPCQGRLRHLLLTCELDERRELLGRLSGPSE